MSCVLTLLYGILGRTLAPKYIKLDKEEVYMNINLSHELWKDVKIKLLTVMDNAHPVVALPFLSLIWNTGNFMCFFILRYIFKLIS
jgi:hypothetical protein